jgi:isoquinoline 1-oxidoreductase alpha subunit
MSHFQLRVNGRLHFVDMDGDMPLLWALRDVLGLKGTKFGCGVAQCGACTVHLDGRAVRSCAVDVGVACLSEITTIEGLSNDGSHPVQQAWIEKKVPQCGFCQPGQIMSAAALVAAHQCTNTPITDDDIDKAMRGNICRCGTYPRIREAIKAAAAKRATP